MYLFDSDTLSHLWARNERVEMRLRQVVDAEVGTTSVTKCEILRKRCENLLKAENREQVVRAQQRLDRSEQLLAELIVIPFDERAGERFEQLCRIRRLKKIGRADLLIASVVLANDAILVTRNLRHFREVPELRFENWVD